MGRHSAPDDEDGDLLVVDRLAAPEVDRPSPRPRHAVADDDEPAGSAALVRTEVIEPEVVERRVEAAPRDVVDAEVVEDERRSPRPRSGPTPELTAPVSPTALTAAAAEPDVAAAVEPAVEPAVESAVEPAEAAPEPATDVPTEKKERGSRTDLRLLRQSSSLRARCLAAILLPFIVYTIVLVVISHVDVYVFWIWIPAILAGILFGAQLDGAMKREREREQTATE